MNKENHQDTPIHGKRVGIRAIRNRYKCQNCGKTYIQPLPFKSPWYRARGFFV